MSATIKPASGTGSANSESSSGRAPKEVSKAVENKMKNRVKRDDKIRAYFYQEHVINRRRWDDVVGALIDHHCLSLRTIKDILRAE